MCNLFDTHLTTGGGPSNTNTCQDREVLPDNVKPTHYNVTVTPNLETFTFTGYVEIHCKVVKDTQRIVVNVNEVTVKNVMLRLIHGKTENLCVFYRSFHCSFILL